MSAANHTTEPVEAGIGAQAEWLSVSNITKYFSISKGLIYQLIAEDAIKSVNLRRKGQTKGKRLVFTDSVRSYFESLVGSDSGTVKNSGQKKKGGKQ